MLPMDVEAILRAHASQPIALLYEKDCYALSLLGHVIGGGRPISVLRSGAFARLLDKAIVKRALAHASSGVLTPRCLEQALPERRETFPITLWRWGGTTPKEWGRAYYQTSRAGENLVLQLNFPSTHDQAYRALVRPDTAHPFLTTSHPVRSESPFTLAWARLDVDVDSSEVLVEEVQCDWVKEVESCRYSADHSLSQGDPSDWPFADGFHGTAPEILSYVERVLRPYARIWQECVLTLAIDFSYACLGARRVFLHTFDGGVVMKRLNKNYGLPPRSLYTKLPESFCFTRTATPPRMFARDRRLERGVEWFVLELV